MLVAVSLATVRRWLCLTPIAKPRRELEQALQWLAWRCLHQRIAQFYHWRRRQRRSGNTVTLSINDYLQL